MNKLLLRKQKTQRGILFIGTRITLLRSWRKRKAWRYKQVAPPGLKREIRSCVTTVIHF